MTRSPPWGSTHSHNQPPRLFLAVDCGGTSAKASISDDLGNILGSGKGGPSNFTDVPQSTFLQSITTAVQLALKNSGVRNYHLDQLERQNRGEGSGSNGHAAATGHGHSKKTSTSSLNRNSSISSTASNSISKLIPFPPNFELFTSAWFGIAGVDSALDVSQVSPLLSDLLNLPFPSSRLIVANDTSLLASPIHDPNISPRVKTGVVLIAGTGSIVVSFQKTKNQMLKTVGRVGGFGWLLGDEGSGYAVGRNALRAVLDQADRERLVAGDEEFEHDRDGLEEEEEQELKGHQIVLQSNLSEDEVLENQEKKQWGHLLRDRILEEWGLVSTDDLLNAVYSSRNPEVSNSNSVPGETSQMIPSIPSSNSDPNNLNLNTLKGLNPSNSPESPIHSHSSRSSIEAHSSPSIFAKGMNRPNPSSNLLPPIAQPFFGENQPPPPPSSPIPPLNSGPASRERTPELEDSSEEEMGEEENDGADENGKEMESRNSNQKETLNGLPANFNSISLHEEQIPTPTSSILRPIPILASSNKSQLNPTTIPAPSQPEPSPIPIPDAIGERKHRLASLAPLVFHLAFAHEDELSLSILRNQIREVGDQVIELVRPSLSSTSNFNSKSTSTSYLSLLPKPETSVLCLGGSLLGVPRYRALLGEYLESRGIFFARMEFVNDPSKSGATALAGMWRGKEVDKS